MKQYTQWYEIILRENDDGGYTASVIHYGGYEFLYEAYGFLTEWIEKNGYEIKNKSPPGKMKA